MWTGRSPSASGQHQNSAMPSVLSSRSRSARGPNEDEDDGRSHCKVDPLGHRDDRLPNEKLDRLWAIIREWSPKGPAPRESYHHPLATCSTSAASLRQADPFFGGM